MKKSKAKLADEGLKDAHFRWEFLRRNERYADAYRKWLRRYPDWNGLEGSWLAKKSEERGQDPSQAKAESFVAKVIGDLHRFREIWGIDPTDPESPYSPFLREHRIWIIDYGPATSAWQNHNDVITLCINVLGPTEDLLRDLKWRIQYEKDRRKLNGSDSPKRRKRFAEYEKYLRAFDLRKAGKRRKEIAELLLAGHVGQTEKSVSNYLTKASKIIMNVGKGVWPPLMRSSRRKSPAREG
jgi:hypothetical protein